jgi:hypothetical protein
VNKDERKGHRRLFAATTEPWEQLGNLAASMMHLDAAPDDSIEAIRNKERMYEATVRSGNYLDGQFWADSWCAAFVWKKTQEFNYPITEEVFRRIEHNPHTCDVWMRKEIERLSAQYQFFHWHLAFPDVFHVPATGQDPENAEGGWNGGFDVVLGNPPWERVKLQEKEWFAERSPEIAKASNAAERERLVEALKAGDPDLYRQFLYDSRKAEGESHFMRNGGRYPLCGRGDVNTYAIFAEGMRNLVNSAGRVGCVLPSGIATDDTTKFFFQDVVDRKSLVSLFDFENKGIFVGVHSSFKFCLFTSGRHVHPSAAAEFVFFAHSVEDLAETERRFILSAEDIARLNPNTRTCPIFRSRRDAELTKAIYARVPVLVREGPPEENPWGIRYTEMFHSAHDSKSFLPPDTPQDFGDPLLPYYEAKQMSHYDHRWGVYRGKKLAEPNKIDPEDVALGQYLVHRSVVMKRLSGRWEHRWRLVWRDITANTRAF